MAVTAGPPHSAPRGQRWVREAVTGVQVLPGGNDTNRKCVHTDTVKTRRPVACNATAVALVDGRPRCTLHLGDGVWIDMDLPWRWVLEPDGSREENQ